MCVELVNWLDLAECVLRMCLGEEMKAGQTADRVSDIPIFYVFLRPFQHFRTALRAPVLSETFSLLSIQELNLAVLTALRFSVFIVCRCLY